MIPSPSPLLEGASNFRDVGGYRNRRGQQVRSGRVFRSDHLARLTAADLTRFTALGITHSLDFRGEHESAAVGYALPGVTRVPLAIEPTVVARLQALLAQGTVPSTEETVALMQQTYRDFVNHNAAVFGRFLSHLLESPTPQVFHCTAGKDRTGFAAALLLSVLEVPRETIEHDYLLTNRLYRRNPQAEGLGPAHVRAVLWQVQADFLHAALDEIDQRHGGMHEYLHGPVGLRPQQIQALQQALLTP
jgi:protein-tyrosine phosphatase